MKRKEIMITDNFQNNNTTSEEAIKIRKKIIQMLIQKVENQSCY